MMSIAVSDIHFSYGNLKVLQGITLQISGGAVGLLGPNGAGKSTFIRILLGFLKPDQGSGTVLEFDMLSRQKDIRRRIGYMPEDECFIPGMDAVSFTSYFGELSGMPRQEAMKRAHEVLFYVGLEESRYRKLETYSAGMKQRLKLAQAIVHDPSLIFLDEPTSGLDPRGRVEILELIKDISDNNDIQVLMSSHILTDIEEVCSRVVILKQGKIVAEGGLQSLNRPDRLYELRIVGNRDEFVKDLNHLKYQVKIREEGMLHVFLPAGGETRDIFRIAAEKGIQIRYFSQKKTSLEDLFADAVGVD